MIVPEFFLYINYTVCFLVGVPLNAFLVWLIGHRSPEEMTPYCPILFLSTITDIVYLTDVLLVMPVVAVKDGLFAFFSIGQFSLLPNPWGFIAINTWEFLFCFSQFSLSVPFVYRYYVICREKRWGLGEFLAMLLVPATLCLEHISLLYFSGYLRRVEESLVGNEHVGFPADSNKTYVLPYFSQTEMGASIVCYNLGFWSSVNYVLIFIFGRRLYQHMNLMAVPHFSQEQARALHKQISTTLILQAVIPMVVEFLPTMNLVSSTIFGLNFGDSTLYMTAIFTWIPVLNPLVTMWVVRAYRREIRIACLKVVASVSVAMTGSRVAPSIYPQIAINGIGGDGA